MRKRLLRLKTHFDSAHYLPGYPGKCANLHGHRWEVVFTFEELITRDACYLADDGILVDFGTLKTICNSCLPDHVCLNDWAQFKTLSPSVENIALWLFEIVRSKVAGSFGGKLVLYSIEVFETPECSCLIEKQ